eukprot:scaffold165576_cov21-Tisochrysis_lutea.AAC.1
MLSLIANTKYKVEVVSELRIAHSTQHTATIVDCQLSWHLASEHATVTLTLRSKIPLTHSSDGTSG